MSDDEFYEKFNQLETQIQLCKSEFETIKKEWVQELQKQSALPEYAKNKEDVFDAVGKKFAKRLIEKENELDELLEKEKIFLNKK